MRDLRVSCLLLALLAGMASTVLAEGFTLNEWSARGVSLAGGMVGRADDVSALAYNAAGITQLPGAHVMGGLAFIAPIGTTIAETGGLAGPARLCQLPVQRQYVFSRFGVGNSYGGIWTGRYNSYDVACKPFLLYPLWPTRSTTSFPYPWAWKLFMPASTWAVKYPPSQAVQSGTTRGSGMGRGRASGPAYASQ